MQTNPNKKRRKKSSEDKALGKALRFIKYRPRSAFEVVKRLQRDGVEANEINSIIIQLTEAKILDDKRFAIDWVRSRDRFSPRGEFLLKRELKERGIEDQIIEEAIEARQSKDWFFNVGLKWSVDKKIDQVLAQQIAKQRLKKIVGDTRDKRKTKIAGLLGRRGFSSDIIYGIIAEIK